MHVCLLFSLFHDITTTQERAWLPSGHYVMSLLMHDKTVWKGAISQGLRTRELIKHPPLLSYSSSSLHILTCGKCPSCIFELVSQNSRSCIMVQLLISLSEKCNLGTDGTWTVDQILKINGPAALTRRGGGSSDAMWYVGFGTLSYLIIF